VFEHFTKYAVLVNTIDPKPFEHAVSDYKSFDWKQLVSLLYSHADGHRLDPKGKRSKSRKDKIISCHPNNAHFSERQA
jgi:hypothetical protein